MGIYAVTRLIGHTDIENTQIYAKVIDKKMEEAVQMLPKVRTAL
jgi:site-specific recombinase XerD